MPRYGLDFAEAEPLFEGDLHARKDTQKDYGEERQQGIGELNGRVAVVVWTDRPPDRRRIISLRASSRGDV
ncbi:MAG: BrnT family toxin [Chloroflexi bacterium]|nr:BrnT family toxin [Chloroflexota bacterium]